MVQWLGLYASNAGDSGSIPGRGIKIPHTKQSDKGKKKRISQHAEGCLCVLIALPLKQVKVEREGEVAGSFRDRREEIGGPVFAL